MRITMQKIADHVGVSKATVSIYLKDPNSKRVGEETRRRIDQALEDLNYNSEDRVVSMGKSKIICALMPRNEIALKSIYVAEILAGVESALSQRGFGLLLLPLQGDTVESNLKQQITLSLGYRGHILFGSRFLSIESLQNNLGILQKANTPFVTVNMPKVDLDVNQVVFTNNGIDTAINSLIYMGHRKIVMMAGNREDPENHQTFPQYQKALETAGLKFDENRVIYGDFNPNTARESLLSYFNGGNEATAVLCMSDNMAIGAYQAAQILNLRIPEDLSVIGRNDQFFASITNPPMSTIKQDIFKAGEEAVEILFRSIATGTSGYKSFLDSHFIARGSIAANTTLNK